MPAPRVCVLRAPGTNCDSETAFAFETCGAQARRIHLFELLENPQILEEFQVLCVPGGFSYGDDIGAGVVFASHLRGRLGDVMQQFLATDKLVLGICNGFQTLLKAGILPDGSARTVENADSAPATLTWNENGKYTARWVHLKVAAPDNVFLKGIEELDLPIAHAEGRIVVRSPQVLDAWSRNRQVALTYAKWPDEAMNERWSANPNGSTHDIAGLGDPSGRVLGLMPHPERFLFAEQHPHWTRRQTTGPGAGRLIFENAVRYFR